MNKFLAGILVGIVSAVAVGQTLKADSVKAKVEGAKKKIYDSLGDLIDKIDPDVLQ